MAAAEAVFARLQGNDGARVRDAIEASWIWDELYRVRNIRPSFRLGLWGGLAYSALDTFVLRGRAPWTFHNHADHTQLLPASQVPPIDYPRPDGRITFDRLSSVFISNTNHEEDQPPHLRLRDPEKAITVNYRIYDLPEQRYCPAGVYEIVTEPRPANRASRSTRRTACTARRATSRTRSKTLIGLYPRAAVDRTIRICNGRGPVKGPADPRRDGVGRPAAAGAVVCCPHPRPGWRGAAGNGEAGRRQAAGAVERPRVRRLSGRASGAAPPRLRQCGEIL